MIKIGIICEYNPFHNGHAYHLRKIKELYPDSLIILALNGYFLERGEISLISKENKTKIALIEGIDLVLEIPFIFGTNSADTFADCAVTILNHFGIDRLIFGSECDNVKQLTKLAKNQLHDGFNKKLKENIDLGYNYPTALSKSLNSEINSPNDLLGIAYIKVILENNYSIIPETIKRTNDYHNKQSNNKIVSASNIREKIKASKAIDKYTDYSKYIENINEELFFNLLKYKILTDKDLSKYLTVDEGLEYKLIKEIDNVNSIDELIKRIKSKRYTYNRLRRMLTHLLIGLTKEDRYNSKIDYIKVLGFNSKGQKYLKTIKKSSNILISSKINNEFLNQKYELISANIYDLITSSNTTLFELNNKPIIK